MYICLFVDLLRPPATPLSETIASISNLKLPPDSYGPLLDDIGIETATNPVTETEASLQFSINDSMPNHMLPAMANPLEMVENPYFDSDVLIEEIPFTRLANGLVALSLPSNLENTSQDLIYEIQATDYPLPFREMGILTSFVWDTTKQGNSLNYTLSLYPHNLFWKRFDRFIVLINNIQVFSVEAGAGGDEGIGPDAYIHQLMDPLNFKKGPLRNPSSMFNNVGIFTTSRRQLVDFNTTPQSLQLESATVVPPTNPHFQHINFPWSFFKTTEMLHPGNTMKIIFHTSAYAQFYSKEYLYDFALPQVTAASNVITLTDNANIARYNGINQFRIWKLTARRACIIESMRTIIDLPQTKSVCRQENMFTNWKKTVIPTSALTLQLNDNSWSYTLNSAFIGNSKEKLAPRYIVCAEIGAYDRLDPTQTLFMTFMAPGAVLVRNIMLNGNIHLASPALERFIENHQSATTSNQHWADWVSAISIANKRTWDNTNTSLNLSSPYLINQENAIEWPIIYTTNGANSTFQGFRFLDHLFHQLPPIINISNNTHDFAGVHTPQTGMMEIRFHLAPFHTYQIDFIDQNSTGSSLIFKYTKVIIFEEVVKTAQYGTGNDVKSSTLYEIIDKAKEQNLS